MGDSGSGECGGDVGVGDLWSWMQPSIAPPQLLHVPQGHRAYPPVLSQRNSSMCPSPFWRWCLELRLPPLPPHTHMSPGVGELAGKWVQAANVHLITGRPTGGSRRPPLLIRCLICPLWITLSNTMVVAAVASINFSFFFLAFLNPARQRLWVPLNHSIRYSKVHMERFSDIWWPGIKLHECLITYFQWAHIFLPPAGMSMRNYDHWSDFMFWGRADDLSWAITILHLGSITNKCWFIYTTDSGLLFLHVRVCFNVFLRISGLSLWSCKNIF